MGEKIEEEGGLILVNGVSYMESDFIGNVKSHRRIRK